MKYCKGRYHSMTNQAAEYLWGVRHGGRPQPNIRCHTQHQWMDNGYPSIFHVNLSRCLKPTTMSISKQFDSFSWLIHQPDLICNLFWLTKTRLKRRKKRDRVKYWIWGNQSSAVQNIMQWSSNALYLSFMVAHLFCWRLIYQLGKGDTYLSSWREVWRGLNSDGLLL